MLVGAREIAHTDTDAGWLQVDCTQEPRLCQEHQITGFPSVRVFRKGSDDITMHGVHEHEAYRGAPPGKRVPSDPAAVSVSPPCSATLHPK